jgi:ribosome biogenesis GTPase
LASRKDRKSRKVRVEFRKNRQVRARNNRISDEDRRDGLTDDLKTDERISGKGDLSRFRTIKGVDDEGALRRDVELADCLGGRVMATAGLNSLVRTEDGREYDCTVRQVVRTIARDSRNAVVTGDEVLVKPLNEQQGVIERVEPRHGVLSRQSAGKEHILVANVDQVLIVASAGDPPLKPHLVDRFIISAEKGNVRPILCINKVDLVDPSDLQPIVGLYAQLGYETLQCSAACGIGIDSLRDVMRGRQTVLSGQSGVGKSSLINRIAPDLALETKSVSGWTKKGKHTTRRAITYPLPFGGWVVDTPGIRQMTLWDVAMEEVEGFFLEFRPFVPLCGFPDCTHTHEQECGVKDAVRAEMISPLRYDSYLKLMDDDIV